MKVLRLFCLSLLCLQCITTVAQTAIQTIKCDADTTQSYSLCLPVNYNPTQKYPVLFMFDPAARGKFAIGLYKNAARDYGFILIASNNSRNGPISNSLNAANTMFTDALKKYSIDNSQVYLTGFSGGARVATTIALQANSIAGVIACGAGFGEPVSKTKLSFTLAATAGTTDFNYVELQDVAQQLQVAGSTYNLQTFNGPHRWPPDDVFYSELLWSYLMHRKLNTDSLLVKYKTLIDVLAAKSSSPVAKANLYRQYLAVTADASYAEKLKELEASQVYIDEAAKAKQMIAKEFAYQQKLGEAFQAIMTNSDNIKPKSWWKGEFTTLNKLLLSSNSADADYMYRQLAFINANAGESFGNYYSAKKYDTAAELLNISDLFDAKNPMIYYRHALLKAAERDESGTLDYLQQAVKRGFTNKAQIRNQPAFFFLNDNKQYKALIN
jgi:pimeloyl-ACP methyl ester carboxylesterase